MKIDYRFANVSKGSHDFNFSEYRYWIVLTGKGEISYSNGTIFLSTHDVLEIPTNLSFHIECVTPLQLGVIEITDIKPGNKDLQKKTSQETELIRKTFFFAVEYCAFEHSAMQHLKFHVDALMYETLLNTGLQEYKINPQIAYFLDNLNRHLFEPNYDVAALIQKTGYSKSHFHKLFHETTGTTPVFYIHDHRMDRAKVLLRQSREYSIKEIATQCGYNDEYYFSRVFRKVVGVSPSKYAQMSK